MSDLANRQTSESFGERELEVLRLIALGWTNQEIADELVISVNTVRYYNKQIYSKLGTNNRTKAITRAQELGLLPIELTESSIHTSTPAAATPTAEETLDALSVHAGWRAYIRRERSFSRKVGLLALVMGCLAVLIVVLLIVGKAATPRFARLNVLKGVVGDFDDTVPSEPEITAARDSLGEDGFVAYITCTLATEYHATQAREMRDFARSYGLDLRIYDSDADDYRQITLLERARSDGAAGLILCPLNGELLRGPLLAVQQAEIPLVLFGSLSDTYGGVLLSTQSDNYEMGLEAGRLAGQVIRDEMNGRAAVIILDYPTKTELVERANGLQAGVLEFAPQAEIIARSKGGTRENGYTSVSQLLNEGIVFDVVLSINDAGAFGAIRALEEANIGPDQVIVSSIDAEQLALQYIRDCYYMRGSLNVGRREIAQHLIYIMTRLLAGGSVPETITRPMGEMITKANLADYEGTKAATTPLPDSC